MERYLRKLEWFREHSVINWHEHAGLGAMKPGEGLENADALVKSMKDAGMEKAVISRPIMGGLHAPVEDIAAVNDFIGAAVQKYPDKLRGLVYVDPLYGEGAIREIDRCRKEWGAIGVKLYNQYTMDDDIQNPIIEYCIEHDLFILMHAGHLTWDQGQPFFSGSDHMAKAAKKYPEAVLQMAHITGGGDWSWQLRGLEDCPNVYCDISGSVRDAGVLEGLVKVMGAERVLFGTDGSFSTSMARLLGARISDSEKLTIMDNPAFRRYWERGTAQ